MSEHATEFATEAPGVVTADSEREGGFVHVYRGELADVDAAVRFLVLAPDHRDGPAGTAFTRVASQWENANTHPNIVSVYDRGDTPRPWVAVARVDGQPLDAAQPGLSPGEVSSVVRGAARAVRNAALYNTVHGALRPDHIWVVAGGETVTALVDDWGLRQAASSAAGAFEPGPFAAPEVLDDPVAGDRRTDVYGLGAVAYYALTARPPVSGPDLEEAIREGDVTQPSAVDSSLPEAVDSVVMQALATEPADRYDSAYAFGEAFGRTYPAEAPPTEERTTTEAAATTATARREEDKPAGSETTDEPDSSVTRRAVLGALAVGGVGAGGVWLATRNGSQQPLVAKSGSSQRGSFTVTAPGVVEVDRQFLLIGGVAEAGTEQFGAFEVYVDGELVRAVGLQEGQAALFRKQARVASPGTRQFDVEVRFVNGERGVDAQVGRVSLQTRARESAQTRIPEVTRVTGSSDRGRFGVGCPSLVPAGGRAPVAGQVTEAATEQYGAFEVYVDSELVRSAGLQEGESARFGRLYPVSDPGIRRFEVEVRFVNGEMNVDERVGRATLEVEAL